jgi:uncharacterized oxidoreductase
MRETGNTVVITGGSSGIGLAAAEVLAAAGNDVIICGRHEGRLRAVKERLPQLHTLVCDVSVRAERAQFFSRVAREFPLVNVLINNAGIQRETDFVTGAPELTDGESEIDTNFTAAVHLSALFIPHFVASNRPCAVVNVTSGLAFIPLKSVPVYCATKAALHSFSISLRSQLERTNTRVFEIIPPIVQTNLHRGDQARRQSEQRGISAKRVAEALLNALKKDRYEASIGEGGDLQWASRIAPQFFHRMLNKLVST